MKKIFFASLFTALLFPAVVSAQTNCQPLYGGGETCIQANNLSINKTVKQPQQDRFVDNLGINDQKFGPDSTVNFRIVVTNTGNGALQNIRVRDIFPQHVTFTKGFQGGSFDNASRTYTVTIDKLEKGQSRTFDVEAKVVPTAQLPQNQGIVCVVNQAQATQGSNTSQDNAQFCIQKEVQAAQATPTPATRGGTPSTTKGGLPIYSEPDSKASPKTGPEALALFALAPSALTGFFLRRKSK